MPQEESLKKNRKCSVEGCTKWGPIKNLCYAHYREKYGETYNQTLKNKRTEPQEESFKKTAQSEFEQRNLDEILPGKISPVGVVVMVDFTSHPELLYALNKKASLEYRTITDHILYLISQNTREA